MSKVLQFNFTSWAFSITQMQNRVQHDFKSSVMVWILGCDLEVAGMQSVSFEWDLFAHFYN